MPSITQLEYIAAVYKHGHFGKAARSCNVSQPSMSMQIQKAEDELGITLFDRSSKPVQVTPAGLKIVEQAQNVLKEHRKLFDLSSESSMTLKGEIRIGVIPTLASSIVPLFLKKITTEFTEAKFIVEELQTKDLLQRLRDESLSLGIVSTPLNEPGLQEKVLFSEPFYLYFSKDHPLTKKTKISEDELDDKEAWLLQDGHCLRNQMLNFCGQKKAQDDSRSLSFESGSLETLRALLRKGYGYTLLPHLFVKELPASERQAQVRSFKKSQPAREVSLIFKRDHWHQPQFEILGQKLVESLPKDLREQDASSLDIIDIF